MKWILVSAVIMGLLISGTVAEEKSSLEGKKVLMVIASRDFRDEEYLKPREILEAQGVKITVASSTLEVATGMLGGKVKPDILLAEAKAEDFKAIIFIGGSGAKEYWQDKKAHSLIHQALKMKKIVAAICIAPVTLAEAGVLSKKQATVWPSEARHLKGKGAVYTGALVERDGNIITASGPKAAREFGQTILKALKE